MSEHEQGKFEGWYTPSEKAGLNESQVSRLNTLERVVVTGDHADSTVGDVEILHTATSHPRDMISPSALLRFVKDTAQENNVSPWDISRQIRELGVEDASQLDEIERKYYERITYISDVHQGSEDLYERLEGVVKNAPDRVIFIGDVIGTDQFDALQKLFYNHLNNFSVGLLKEQPDITDTELLAYRGDTRRPDDDFTLREGFRRVRAYELKLAGLAEEQINATVEAMTDEEISEGIRKYKDYENYGHYASNLDDKVKEELAAGLQANSQKLLEVIKRMQAAGSDVRIIEGNWDARAPIDFIPGEPEKQKAVPLPKEDRLFNPKEFFEANGVPFHDSISTLETKTTMQVLLPFDSITDFPNTPEDERVKLVEQVTRARSQHKSIIVAAHGEPNYQIHNLPKPDAQPNSEHAKVIAGLEQALVLIKPDELVYGHMHNLLTDEEGQVKEPNTKYALQIGEDDTISLQSDPDKFSSDSIVVSYLPWKREAELKSSKVDRNNKINGFGGSREPVNVK